MKARVRKGTNRAFTLVEILIVVVILGILAAIVIPQFTSASQEATESSVKSMLQTIRSQIELYKVKNNGAMPDLTANWDDLLLDANGEEYLQASPINPITGGITVGAASDDWQWDGADITAGNPLLIDFGNGGNTHPLNW